MKNMLRRNLALLLAVVMILSCAPLDGMAAVIGASQLFDQFADQLATDYSGGASIARIVQPPAAVDTYVFKVDEETIATQKVKKGDVLYEPAAPSKDGCKFTGWRDAAGSAPVFGLVEAEATGETYTYTAQFDQVYYVFFMDDQGRVQITREGTAGDAISTQVTIKLQNAQAAVTGWYYDAALTQPVQEGHVTLSDANITLWPKVEEGYYLTFETNGGTYYPPAFYMPGQPTGDPGVPQKAGYSFTGWKDETGASFTFGSALTADKTLTAQWQANQNTQYTVIHWKENANDDGYSFEASEEKAGTTGAQTAAAARNYTGFTAQTITQKSIAADGSTIVSVYYKRNVYEVKFYTANGYSSREYTALRITAKYGASIGDKWPTYNGSSTWATKSDGSGPYQVNIDTMPLNGAKFYGPKTGYGSETAYYYVEVLPGETGTVAVGGKSYKLHHQDTSPGTGYTVTVEDQYPITGYTFNASVSTKTGGRYNNAKFYYTRNSYDIIYMNGGSEVAAYRTSVLFEQTIPGAANKPAPTPPMGKENYTFEGWYDDPAGQMLHAFSGKMPAQNITVYAKWAPPTVSGTAYITMAGNGSAPISIAYGGTINPDDLPTPTAPEGDGWEFVAWATKDGDVYTPFNFDTKIYENIELYPYYVNKNQYQVTYRPGEGTGTVEDTRRYASGAEADVKAAAGLTPPAGKVFVGWKVGSTDEIKQPGDKLTITGNMTLTAQWGDAPAAVTLTYYGNGGKTADGQTSTSVTHENNATISTLGSTAFTRRGYTLTGWNTQANGQGDPFNCDVPVLIDSHGDNALYAVWALDAEQTVTVTYASEDAQKGTVSHTGDTIQIVSGDPVTGSTATANPGYTFVGWYKGEALISSEAALTAATAKASLNKDADGLYADTTYIARFTERTDLSYTVHYYWNGTATPVAESKTVDGQTYNASITESPAAVDGYTPVSADSKTITIGAETNKIIFYYYKNVELTAKGDNVTYDGKEHTVSGFTGAPEAADFSAIQVGARGTNAGTYPAAFREDAVGTVDATRKYIVTKATDGALVINPIADKVTVTVTEKSDTVTYDGQAHSVHGYATMSSNNALYNENIASNVAAQETAAWTATGTDAGEYPVGIEAKDFKNINENFTNVEFEIVDGVLKIDPVATKVTVTVTENSGNATYDGTEHTVTGYESITADNTLYNVKASVKETPTAAWTAKGTDAGEYPVGVKAEDFENTNKNFDNVEFVIVDGVLKIDPVKAEVTVTIVGNHATVLYNAREHTVQGYTATSSNPLFNVDTDFTYGQDGPSGEAAKAKAKASGVNVKRHEMGLQSRDFVTVSQNFQHVTYAVTDGYLDIEKRPVAVEVANSGKVYGEADPAFDNATLRFYEGQQIITPNTEMQAELAGIDLTVHRTDAGNDTVGTHEDVLVISKTAEELRVQYPNYLIGVNPGDFEITATAESLSVRAKNYENAYDGKAHGVVAKAYINKNEEAGAAQIKYWNEATGAYDLDESPAYTDVKSATPGDRVYTVRFQATLDGLTAEGSANVLIAPQELVFTSNSASRDYTGQPLTSPDVTLSSGHIINGEIYDYEATGTVTNAYDGEKGDGVVTNTIVYSTTAAFKPVNYEIVLEPGKLEINPREVKLTSQTKSKEYDGTPLTMPQVTIGPNGFVEGEVTDIRATGSVTYVTDGPNHDGVVTNTIEYTPAGNFDARNYRIEKNEGVLSITRRTGTMVIETLSDSKVYDGSALYCPNQTLHGSLADGDRLVVSNYVSDLVNVGSKLNTFESFRVENEAGQDVTANYTFGEPIYGTLEITARPLTITVADNTVTYDGQHHGKADPAYTVNQAAVDAAGKDNGVGLVNPAVGDKTQTHTLIGTDIAFTAVNAGTYENQLNMVKDNVKILSGNQDVTGNYAITILPGTLTISQRPVTFTGETATKVYNGEAQSITTIAQSGLVEGHTLADMTYAATGTDAGEYPGAFKDEAKIMNGTEDVTANYAITKKEGQLTITAVTDKVIVTVTEKSGTVTYDGQAHSVHGYATMSSNNALYNVNIASNVAAQETAAWTATGTDAGEYPVGIEAKDFKNISQNFTTVEFKIVDGSLIINPITEKTITITAASEEKAYDGTALTNGRYTYTQGVLVNGDVLTATVEGSQTDAGSSANRVTGYKVMHGETDVTKNYTFAQSKDGTLTVKPVAIELTANSAEKIYDGTPLTDNGYQITKGAFVGEEGLASVTVEGSQTLVGTSANEIRAHGLKANTKAQNYAITYQPGQLTVKDRNEKYRLTVEANSGSKVYDGTALKVEGFKQLIFTVNEQTFTVSGLTAEKTATNVSESGAVAVRGTAIVKDAAGNDVTAQFDVQTVPGTLTISQRPVTITAENNTVEYTGKPHGANPAKPYTVEAAAENSGLAGGHQESNVNIAFTAINVGTYVGALEIAKNDVVILADGADVTANYTISVLPGTLEITGDKIIPGKTTPQQVESNYKLGDTIPFTITVKNVSTAIVENIIVEDPNAILVAGQGYSVSEDGHTATILSLAPDAQVEIQAQHVVTEADILAGTVGNTATVAWENTTRTVEAKTEEIEEPNSALGVTKETTSTPKNGKTYALGETITYKITVTNTGNLTAKNIQVTDSLSAKEGQVIATIDSLAPGASQEIPFAYVVTEQDILNGKVVNEAAAKGETDDPDKKPEGGDEKEDETDDVDATLEVVKTSNKQEGQSAGLGETIEYTITVTNKGNVTYRNVKVDDELTGLHETIDELGVGASESFTTTYTVTEEDILKGHVRNVATAAADPIHNPKTDEDEIPKGSDEVTDETVAAEGALGVTKETTSTPKNGKTYALGETITYKITVTNTGNLTAKNIQVTDSLSAKEGQVIATIDSLAPGASQEIPFAYVVTEQDILNGKVVNEAAAKGETDDPDKKPEGGDEKEDETDDVDATLEVVKTSNKQEGQSAGLGETIEYTITVTNKGNVTYRNVKVDDELTGLHETIDELGVGASESFTTTYTVTEEDILKGHVRNVATAEGDKVPDPKNPDDPKKPAGEDEQDDPTDEPDASLTVVKSLTNRPNKGYFTLGETAEFDVVVTNTGNVTLKNIRLTEMLEGAEFVTGEGYTVKNGQAVIEELKPGQEDGDGQSVTVKATYTIQTKDLGMGVLKNIVAGEGEGPGKNPDDEGGTEFDVDYAKQVNAVKVWEDEENKHETRPAAITFVLMDESTGEELDRKDATAANEWSVSFDNLPAHDADGNEIIYVLKEIEVTGYDTRYGGPVEPTVAPPVIQGAPETDKGGEQIPGDAEQDEPVERDVHKIDQTIINTLRSHKLTIRYWVEVVGGQKAFDTYEKEYYYNEQYSVVSPGMYGYEPDLPRVQGRMPDEDLEIDVVYVRQIYKLTIYYIFEDGTTAHKEYEAKLYADEKFEVESPEINGYKPNLWMISGVMPDRNLNYTVIYIARTKPVEIQEAVAPLGVGSVVPNTGDCFD